MINTVAEPSQMSFGRVAQVTKDIKQEVKVKMSNEEDKRETSYSGQQEDKSVEKREKAILDAIEKASGKIEVDNKGLQFSIHEKTNQIMIKVVDNNTKEVIKELPSEKVLDMVAKMVELSGSFIDEKR